MKTIKLLFCGTFASMLFFTSCQKAKETKTTTRTAIEAEFNRPPRNMGACEPNAYLVTLISSNVETGAGTWEWTWTVQNPNPGNGLNGTTQNMSHWGFPIATCVDATTIVGAAYSADGVNWNNFTPTIQPDPSQPCISDPVLKFDFGTNASAPSYYKLVLSAQYEVSETATAYYKSGSNTGCCLFQIDGMGCVDDGEIR